MPASRSKDTAALEVGRGGSAIARRPAVGPTTAIHTTVLPFGRQLLAADRQGARRHLLPLHQARVAHCDPAATNGRYRTVTRNQYRLYM